MDINKKTSNFGQTFAYRGSFWVVKRAYVIDILKFVLTSVFLYFWNIYLQPTKKFVSRDLSKEIRAKAAPFVEWLQTAEEDSEEEEEEEENDPDIAVRWQHMFTSVYRFSVLIDWPFQFSQSTYQRPVAAPPTSNGASNGAVAAENDEEELDIDDI